VRRPPRFRIPAATQDPVAPRDADLPTLQLRLAQLGERMAKLTDVDVIDDEHTADLELEATKLYLGMQRVRLQLQQRTLRLQAADLLRSTEYAALSRDIESSRRSLAQVQQLRAQLRRQRRAPD
jgi:hypothetical protein